MFCDQVEKSDTPHISKNILDFQEYSGITLDHLKFFEIGNFTNLDIEVEFMKFIIAKSPMLEKARIELSETVTVEEELKILRDFIPLPFPLASPSTKFIIGRPKLFDES
ncbi:FBD domain, Leucine-rich repeat domain, L domain-like protein [Artemisia annua]|uniref:FBD domain, Leucine-rich repeat domain, L domain-like protein n=1 Tax=Artemisia annua TaxID=35608 RepID=A0A2U1PFN0_ARTAN|nr:FBD domain, Leucine-rich repeat domain, L domain-like protein [Artemisia annua]